MPRKAGMSGSEGVVGKVPGDSMMTRQLASGLPYFFQPAGLLALLQALTAQGIHSVVYSGYTLEALRRRPEPEVAVP